MNINSLFKSIRVNSEIINYQTIRWRRVRKPFWLGIAKSKMFVIPEPKDIGTPEDVNEYKKLERRYNTQLKSILNFIQNVDPGCKELNAEGNTSINISLQNEITESLKVNELWNAESAKRREIRMKENKEKNIKNAIEIIEAQEKINKEHMEVIEEIVRKEKVLSETYITPENLDEAVEKCLSKIDSFDFAIDLKGNKYYGRETLPITPTANSNKAKLSEENVA